MPSILRNEVRLLSLQLLIVFIRCSLGFGFSNGWNSMSPAFHRGAAKYSQQLGMVHQKRGRPKGPVRTVEARPPMNEDISFAEVRVVVPSSSGAKDESIGIMSKEEAILKAKQFGVDLILINENGDPPVCKIMDYSKFRYIKEKLLKEKKKGSKGTEVKEVKMSYKIDVHDYEVRKRSIEKFAMQGNRVKCSIVFKGREIQHDALGLELLERLAKDLAHICLTEGKPKRDGKTIGFWLTPKPDVLKKINERKRAEERAAKKKKEDGMNSKNSDKMESTGSIVVENLTTEDEEDEEMEEDYEEEDSDDDDDNDDEIDKLLSTDVTTNNLFA
jgi:translation initiation factor IF-3